MTLPRDRQIAPRHCRSGGFTLVEALIALILFAFVLAGLSFLLVTTVETNAQARRLTSATNLALGQLETLRNNGYTSAAGGSAANNPMTESGATGGIYTLTWTVTNNTPVSDTKTITPIVTWSDKDGSHTVRLPSVISP